MTEQNTLYEWCNRSREISGKTHYLLKRFDGVYFYLDDALRYALENFSREKDLESGLLERGVEKDEITDILNVLDMAGLIGSCNFNE